MFRFSIKNIIKNKNQDTTGEYYKQTNKKQTGKRAPSNYGSSLILGPAASNPLAPLRVEHLPDIGGAEGAAQRGGAARIKGLPFPVVALGVGGVERRRQGQAVAVRRFVIG